MRQPLEPHLGGRDGRIGVVGKEVAAADLDRVHPQLRRGHVHQTFGHGDRDGVAHGAILAGRCLVLEDDRRLGPVVLEIVGPAAKVHDLVALDRRGAGIDRIGADRGPVVDVEGEDLAVLVHGDAPPDLVIAGVDVGGEAFQPVGDELHRARHDLRDGRRRDLVGVDVDLDAVGPAHVPADDADPRFRQVEVLRQHDLNHVRRLRGVPCGHLPLPWIPVHEDGARFERDAGVPSGLEMRFHHGVRGGEGRIDVAFLVQTLEGEVVAHLRMQDRRGRIERAHHVGDLGQRVVVDLHQGRPILRRRATGGDDRGDGFADPGGAVHRDGVFGRRFQPLEMRQHPDPGSADRGDIGTGEDAQHTLDRQCLGRVDPGDPGMGVGTADEGDMHHARQHHVVDIGAAPLHQTLRVRARHGLADVAVGPVRVAEGGVHDAPPARACATLSMASTIAS